MAIFDIDGNVIAVGGGDSRTLPNIALMGDSITDITDHGWWVDTMCSIASVKSIRNYAVGGVTWGGILAQFNRLKADTDAGQIAPDVVFIMAGTNDATAGTTCGDVETVFDDTDILSKTPSNMAEHIRYVCESILTAYPTVQLVLATPIQTGAVAKKTKMEEIAQCIRDCAAKLSATLIDAYAEAGIYGYMESIGDVFLSDNTHPSKTVGSEHLGRYMAQQFLNKVYNARVW